MNTVKKLLLTMALLITALFGTTVLCAAASGEEITGTAESTDIPSDYSTATLASADTVTLDTSVQYQQSSARTILDMVNDLRTGSDAWYYNEDGSKYTCSGLTELTYDYKLEEVAMLRAAEIAISFSHTRPNGTTCWTAYDDCGYSYSTAGENIAAGQTSAEAAFTSWEEENEDYSGQGHRRNMLSSSFQSIGIACVKLDNTYYWVQEFSGAAKSTSSTTANNSSTAVSIQALSDNITSVTLTPDVSSYTLVVGKSAALPVLTEKVKLTETWPSARTITNSYTWKSKDSSCASVSNGKVVANAPGSTKLSATVLDTKATVPVTVTLKKGAVYTVGNFQYKITDTASDGSGKVTLTKPNKKTLTKAEIPAKVTIEGISFKVTKIQAKAFQSNKKLKTVTIGKNVTAIGDQAFSGCTKMTKVTIGTGTKKIGKKSFYNCKKLKTITIQSKKLKTIGSKAITGIRKKASIKVPSNKKKAYKKLFTSKTGYKKTMKIK